MRKTWIALILVCFVAGASIGAWLYNKWFRSPNTRLEDPYSLYIPRGAGFQNVADSLSLHQVLLDMPGFDRVAHWMKYSGESVPSGHYIIQPGWSNYKIISKLRSGNQDPIRLTISTARFFEELALQFSEKLDLTADELMQIFNSDSTLDSLGYNRETFISLFIPNTYEVYWNIETQALLQRMIRENNRFWNSNGRLDKLSKTGLSKSECVTLASIVEKETNHVPERATIAGVYINRLKRGIPLQADPTVVFGIGDFEIRRVLNSHLQHDSPYNTYLNSGLPPGPICMPSISSIDAVLSAESHDYIFFCAKPGYNGEHAFARNNAEHERNARIYRNWLNKEGIMK